MRKRPAAQEIRALNRARFRMAWLCEFVVALFGENTAGIWRGITQFSANATPFLWGPAKENSKRQKKRACGLKS